jgi:hypothetical protein
METSFNSQTNNGGNSEVSPGSGLHTEDITFGGTASTRIVFVDTINRTAGDRCVIRAELPATAGITINITSGTIGGPLLFSYNTDGISAAATFEVYFNASSVWQPLRAQVPA